MNRIACFAISVLAILVTSISASASPVYSPVNFSSQANFTWLAPQTDPNGTTATYFPGGPAGSVTLGGIPFNISSNTAGFQAWNGYVASSGGNGTVSITMPVGNYGVTDVYTLINTYWGAPGVSHAALVFTGSSGASFTYPLVGSSDIRDWCCGGTINGTSTINVYSEASSPINGAAGFLDMQHIVLPAAFATQTLLSIQLIDSGATGVQRIVLDGVTVRSVDPLVHDLTADWSDTSNPNLVWSYNEGPNPLPSVIWGGLQPGWAYNGDTNGGFGHVPVWMKLQFELSEDLLVGDVVVHSSDSGRGENFGPANVTWTSPSSTVIDISGSAWIHSGAIRSNEWILYLNETSISSGQMLAGGPYNRANPFQFSEGSGGPAALKNIAVSPGDVVRLEIVKLSQFGTFVGVNLRITPPSSANQLTSIGNGIFWIGLKNSDDQGTSFDLRAGLYKNGELVSGGQTLCVAGVTRNPALAKEVAVPFASFSATSLSSGDMLSLKVLTRIGTNPNGTKCPGHSNAVGLRLYYGATNRPSRCGAEITPDPLRDFFLHTTGAIHFLNTASPTAASAMFRDSAGINFAGGNPWKEIGTWSRTQP